MSPLIQDALDFTPHFDGATYDPERDHVRLSGQLGRVFKALDDGQWRTLAEIGDLAKAPAQSVSARLRDLRKPRFGGFEVARRHRGDPKAGLWEYQLVGSPFDKALP